MSIRQPYLHLQFLGEHVLISNIVLDSWSGFASGSALVVAICLLERFLTYSMEVNYASLFFRRTRWRRASYKAILQFLTTILRLLYMLVAMTFHIGLILVIAATLAFAQFFIEAHKTKSSNPTIGKEFHYHPIQEPLLQSGEVPFEQGVVSRSHQASRPGALSIHNSDTPSATLAVTELEMGHGGDTEALSNSWDCRNGPETFQLRAS